MPGAWTAPSTWTPGLVVTDTMLNAQLRDNMLWLGGTTGVITQLAVATAVTSGPTTASTTFVDMPEMTVTLTTTGGDLMVWLSADLSNSAITNFVGIAIALDGGAEASEVAPMSTGAGAIMNASTFCRFAAPSATSHTVRGRWHTQGGTATTPTGRRYMMVMERAR